VGDLILITSIPEVENFLWKLWSPSSTIVEYYIYSIYFYEIKVLELMVVFNQIDTRILYWN